MAEIILKLNGVERSLTPENAMLMIHNMGKTAIEGVEYDNNRFDYIMHRTEDQNMILFREQFPEFNKVGNYMVENGYESMINRQKIGKVAMEAYFALMDRQVESAMGEFDDDIKNLLEGGDE